MTRNEILALAQEAGLEHVKGLSGSGIHINHFDAFTRFAHLCRADLEAENAKLKQTMVDGVTIQQYIDLDNEADVLKAENEKLRQMLVSFTESDYIKKQHPKRYAVARTLLGETK